MTVHCNFDSNVHFFLEKGLIFRVLKLYFKGGRFFAFCSDIFSCLLLEPFLLFEFYGLIFWADSYFSKNCELHGWAFNRSCLNLLKKRWLSWYQWSFYGHWWWGGQRADHWKMLDLSHFDWRGRRSWLVCFFASAYDILKLLLKEEARVNKANK